MKKIALLVLGVIIVGAFFVSPPVQASFNSIFFQSACAQPIAYTIGNIDPRYKISNSDFKNDIFQAANIWQKSYGKILYEFDPNAKLKINLVYDERQANFSQTESQSNQVKNLGSQVDQLGNELTQNKNNLLPQIQAYQQQLQDFNTQVQKLNDEIAYWNQRGGAPPDTYNQINQERADLQKQADSLNQQAQQLNQQKDQYNLEVNQFNSQVNNLNDKANQLNQSIGQLQQTLQQKPEEGIYDPNVPKIDIYFDISQPELIETIAHELGHARGLEHNQNPKSIMYPFTNKVATPSADDLKDLNDICKTKSLPEIFLERAQVSINFYQQLLQNYFQNG